MTGFLCSTTRTCTSCGGLLVCVDENDHDGVHSFVCTVFLSGRTGVAA